MYCGKCGTEVNNGVAFCPFCGSKLQTVIEEAPKAKEKTSIHINKKIIVIPIVIIGLIALIIAGYSPVMHIIQKPTKEDEIIFANNTINGKFAVTIGNEMWYISETDNENYINKIKLPDGKSKEIFKPIFEPEDFYVHKQKIYFNTGFMSGNIDPINNKVKHTDDDDINYAKSIYYKGYTYSESSLDGGDNGLFVSKNGKNEKKIIDIRPNRIVPFNDYIFFMSSADIYNDEENKWKGLWRMDLDGENIIQILDYSPKYLVSDGTLIYYTNEDDYLISADMDGKVVKEYNEHIGDGLNIKDGIIYFSGPYEDGIYALGSDGSKTKIVYGIAQGIILADDYIVYYDGSNICCTDLNGENSYKISEYDIFDYSDIYMH